MSPSMVFSEALKKQLAQCVPDDTHCTVHTHAEAVWNASAGHVTRPSPQKSTCHKQRLQSQQAVTKEKPRLRIPSAAGPSADVCVCGSLLHSKKRTECSRSAQAGVMTPAFPEFCVLLRRGRSAGLSSVGEEWQGKPSNEAAWTGACVAWSAIWNSAASPSFPLLLFPCEGAQLSSGRRCDTSQQSSGEPCV